MPTFAIVQKYYEICRQKRRLVFWAGFIAYFLSFALLLVSVPSLPKAIPFILTFQVESKSALYVTIFFILAIFVFPAIFIYGICMVVFTFYARRDLAYYRRIYKAFFVAQALSKTFKRYSHQSDGGIPYDKIAQANIFRPADSHTSNDLVTGKYKDVNFIQCDLHLYVESTDSEGNTSLINTFYGRWLIFEFKKNFSSHLQVIGSHIKNYRIASENKYKIKLESDSFNKAFKVYGQDELEARYILTPDIMERMEALSKKHHGKILFGFAGNQLHIAIADGNDAFEPPAINKPLDEATELAKVSEEIKVITDIVDHLKLNRK